MQGKANKAGSDPLMRQIRHYQNGTSQLITEEGFREFVLPLLATHRADLQLSETALTILHYAAEDMLTGLMKQSQAAAGHAKRVKVTRADMHLALDLAEETSLKAQQV